MPNKNGSFEKMDNAISACLDLFCKKGLYETTSRDLSKALKLQSGGMYSYFENKDEAVLRCAEEAAFLLEKYLIEEALLNLGNIDLMFDELITRAEKLAHMMKFFSQVCSVPKYKMGMEPILKGLTKRQKKHARQISELMGEPISFIEPLFFISVSSISNYMIFEEKDVVISQIEFVKKELLK